MTRRRTAAVVCSTWLAALAIGAPVLADPGGGNDPANAPAELQEEYPLHEQRECCSETPKPAAGAVQPATAADGAGDGDGGLPSAAPILLALLAAVGVWLVVRLIPRTARGSGAATATAGHVDPAIDRRVDVPPPPRRPRRVAAPAVEPDDSSTATSAIVRSDLSEELAEWTKLELVWSALSLDLSDQVRERIDDGQQHWRQLTQAIDESERLPKDEEARAIDWTKHANKARRKLRRGLHRDGMPDPFEMPDIEANELGEWIAHGAPPLWAIELRAQTDADPPAAEQDDFVTQIVNAALGHLGNRSWQWSDGAEEAVAEVAASLSESREEHDLVLDAIALGYWIRYVERDFTEVNIADPEFVADLRSRYGKRGAAEISVAMAHIATEMPAAFLRGPVLWAAVQADAGSMLEQRATLLMAQDADFDPDAEISPEARELAFALGYGLGVTVESLAIDAVRERTR